MSFFFKTRNVYDQNNKIHKCFKLLYTKDIRELDDLINILKKNLIYRYEQSDGSKQDQEGELRNKDTDNEALFVKGSFTWVGPDGVTYTINYEAGENGYRPEIEQGPGGSVPADVAASLIG